MKFLNDLIEQARQALVAMPPGNRLIAVGLVIAIAVGLGFLATGTTTGSGEYLFGGRVLDEEELTQAEFAFSKAELREWERVGNRLRVPTKNRDEYLRALAEANALPRDLDWATQEALKNSNLFEPSAQREDRLARADLSDLQTSIEAFPEVRSALVKPAIGKYGLNGTRPVSASVVVTPRGNQSLSIQRIEDIKKMVAAAFPGMKPESVQVTDTNRQPGMAQWLDSDDPIYKAKKQFEVDYESKIQGLLSDYGPLRLAVSVEVDPTLDTNSTTIRYEGTPQTIAERSSTKTNESIKPGPGGVPGVASNAYGNKGMSIDPNRDQTAKLSESTEAADRVVGQEQTKTRKAGLAATKCTVSVGIPRSKIEIAHRRDWLLANPDKKPEDVPQLTAAEREKRENDTRTSIQEAVTTILPPVPAGNNKFPLVNVFYYVEDGMGPKEVAAPAPAALTWLAESWQTLALVGFALAALWMVRSFVRGAPTPDAPEFANAFGIEFPKPPQDELAIDSHTGNDGGPILEISGTELKDQLTDLIDNNPDAAANILRAWIEDEKAA